MFVVAVDEITVEHRFSISIALLVATTAVAQTTTTLTPVPAVLAYVWQTGGPLPAAQSVSVKAGNSTVAYTTTILPAGTQWITLTPSSGSLPATMSF